MQMETKKWIKRITVILTAASSVIAVILKFLGAL